MKILLLSASEDYALGWSYHRAFEQLGHECRLLDPAKLLARSPLWRNRVSHRLLERPLIEHFNRQWLDELVEIEADMVWVGKGAWATPWLWEQYRERRPGTLMVCYNADDPVTTYSRGGNRPWVTQSIGAFDLFCTYKPDLRPALKAHGARKVAVVPFAWDPQVHPSSLGQPLVCDLIFVGNGDEYREQWLDAVLSQPWFAHRKVAVYGKWPGVRSAAVRGRLRGEGLTKVGMAKAIASSKVSINILRIQNEGSHNMRTFETPGSGGVNASQYSEQQNAFFPQGIASYYFRSMDEAGDVLRQAIEDDEGREAMRAEASRIVKHHTYLDRAKLLLENLG